MKDIQLQLQMAKELGSCYNNDRERHVNKIKMEYSVLLRELRKRKNSNKRHIFKKMKILGWTNSSKVLIIILL